MSQELKDDFGNFDFVNDDDRGANNLPEMLKYSPNTVGLINAVMPEIQELNDAQQDIYATINIFEAVGTQLDDIFGEILDKEREQGQTDDEYRAILLAVIPGINGSGTITIVKSVLKSLSGADSVSMIEIFPHTILLHIFVDDFSDISDKGLIDSTMKEVKGGGITMDIAIELNNNGFFFTENVNGGATGEGFATLTDGSDGGAFASLEKL